MRNNVICSALSKAKLNNHRGDRLKRKVPGEEEDREMERRMMALMEESTKYNRASLDRMNNNMAEVTSTIKAGFSLMRELLLQPSSNNFAHPHSRGVGYGQLHGHPPAFIHSTPHPSTPAFQHTPRPQPANQSGHTPTHATL